MKITRQLTVITVAGLLALGTGACSSSSSLADGRPAASGTPAASAGGTDSGGTDSGGTDSSGTDSGAAATTKPGGSGPTTAGSPRQKYVLASPTTSKARPAPSTTSAGGAANLRYTQIQEPFSLPGECREDGSTLEMTACVLEHVIDVDSTIDAAQLNRFERTAESKRAVVLTEYARWLAGRSKTCNASATSGGSLDQITVAQCLLRVSQARAKALGAG